MPANLGTAGRSRQRKQVATAKVNAKVAKMRKYSEALAKKHKAAKQANSKAADSGKLRSGAAGASKSKPNHYGNGKEHRARVSRVPRELPERPGVSVVSREEFQCLQRYRCVSPPVERPSSPPKTPTVKGREILDMVEGRMLLVNNLQATFKPDHTVKDLLGNGLSIYVEGNDGKSIYLTQKYGKNRQAFLDTKLKNLPELVNGAKVTVVYIHTHRRICQQLTYMSLILTQSTPGNANSYVNRFKNTFELPPNAEIAVQEVVMNRKASFTVRPDIKFYVRHTPDGVINSVHTQIVVTLFEGVYDAAELAAHIQERLRACDTHPQYQTGWKCTAEFVKQEFDHFLIKVTQLDQDTTAATPAEGEVISSDAAIQYAAATQLVSMVDPSGKETSFVTLSRPMTNNLGVFSVQIPQLNRGNNRTPAAILWRTHGSINNSANKNMNPNTTAWDDTVFGITIKHSARASDAPGVQSTTGTS